MKKLCLLSIVLCGLSWSVAVVAGQGMVLIVKIVERQSRAEASLVFEKLTLNAQWVPGALPKKKTVQRTPYELQVLNSEEIVIYSQGFDFIRHLEVPLPEPGSEKQEGPSRVELEEPEAVLVIPYLPEGKTVRVKGPEGTSPTLPIPAAPASSPSDSSEPSPPPAKEGNLYILLLASGYSDMSDFQTKAQEVRDFLFSKEPFASQRSAVTISIYENTADLGCNTGCYDIDRLICCDSQKVISAAVASGQMYDEIVIIHNTETYSGGGYRDYGLYKTDSTYSYCQVYNGPYTTAMVLHEFGHSFGDLCDEYSYGSEEYDYYDCVNCRASCSDWADVSLGCQLSCDARSDYYRPEDSIMSDLTIPYYNQPSIYKSLVPKLNYFAPPSPATKRSTPMSIFQLLLL